MYRRLVSTSEVKLREEEATPIHIADVARMTAAPRDAPDVQQPNISIDPDRRAGALNVPLRSSHTPGWNLQGKFVTEITAEKHRRLPQRQELQTNLQVEFATPPKRRDRKSKSSVNVVISPCLHLSCPQSYTQAIRP